MTQYLSGPIFFAQTSYQEKTYIFLGDSHFGFHGICPTPCQDFENNTGNCIDIIRYLDREFINANLDNNYIDFYIEAEYQTKYSEREQEYHGFLSKIKHFFDTCIYSSLSTKTCPYPNVRFHYADI